jgi:HEAT repeat protein
MRRHTTRTVLAVTMVLLTAPGASSKGAEADKPDKGAAEQEKKVREAIASLQKKNDDPTEPSHTLNRVVSIWDLAQIGPPARSGVPVLTSALEAKNPTVRLWAAVALINIDPKRGAEEMAVISEALAEQGVPKVLSLDHPMMAFGTLQPVNKEVVAGLLALARHEDRMIVACARHALENVGPATREAVPLLVTTLKDDDPSIRIVAATALVKIDASRKPRSISVIEAALEDDSYQVRYEAARALIGLDRERTGKACEALLPALKEERRATRLFGAEVLLELDPSCVKDVLPVLLAIAEKGEKKERLRALALLAECGPDAESGEKALRSLLDDKDAEVGRSAAETLMRVRPGQAGEYLQALARQYERLDPKNSPVDTLKALDAQEQRCRKAADPETALKEFIKKTLVPQLKGKELGERWGDLFQVAAAIRLGNLGATAKVAVFDLRDQLHYGEPLLQVQAAYALGRIGSDARDVAPLLVNIHKSRDVTITRDFRKAAAEAVKRIDPETAKKEGIR